MTPAISVSAPYEITHAQRARKPKVSLFSRWHHFVIALIPFAAALTYFYVQTYLTPGVPVTYVSPLKEMLAIDATWAFRILCLALFVLGTGTAVALIRAINKLEAWERNQSTGAYGRGR